MLFVFEPFRVVIQSVKPVRKFWVQRSTDGFRELLGSLCGHYHGQSSASGFAELNRYQVAPAISASRSPGVHTHRIRKIGVFGAHWPATHSAWRLGSAPPQQGSGRASLLHRVRSAGIGCQAACRDRLVGACALLTVGSQARRRRQSAISSSDTSMAFAAARSITRRAGH